ncbi:hypothetical protein RJT34_04557 [Clitoria ternatea]|uniref:Uncharacterized protein n=1 Tax=Clitoria ternatea TaxID=43366 RepID=A0AAN9KM96_CLITE
MRSSTSSRSNRSQDHYAGYEEISTLYPLLIISWEGVDPFKVVVNGKVTDPPDYEGEDFATDPRVGTVFSGGIATCSHHFLRSWSHFSLMGYGNHFTRNDLGLRDLQKRRSGFGRIVALEDLVKRASVTVMFEPVFGREKWIQ